MSACNWRYSCAAHESETCTHLRLTQNTDKEKDTPKECLRGARGPCWAYQLWHTPAAQLRACGEIQGGNQFYDVVFVVYSSSAPEETDWSKRSILISNKIHTENRRYPQKSLYPRASNITLCIEERTFSGPITSGFRNGPPSWQKPNFSRPDLRKWHSEAQPSPDRYFVLQSTNLPDVQSATWAGEFMINPPNHKYTQKKKYKKSKNTRIDAKEILHVVP